MALIKYNTNDFKPTSFRSFVDEFFNDEYLGGSTPTFNPRVDVLETEKEFQINLHVPGMSKTDFAIDLKEDEIIISGERKFDDENKGKNYHRIESHYGSFRRSFHLPQVVDREKINAKYEDGVLRISLPKDEKKEAEKQITIK